MEVTRPCWRAISGTCSTTGKKNGEPLTFRTQYARLVPVRAWFRWMVADNHILHNPASDLDMPKLEKRLPRAVLNEEEAERVMIAARHRAMPLGVRDRAILETFYSTGIRRTGAGESETLQPGPSARDALDLARARARRTASCPSASGRWRGWTSICAKRGRSSPCEPDDGTVFLSIEGGPFIRTV